MATYLGLCVMPAYHKTIVAASDAAEADYVIG